TVISFIIVAFSVFLLIRTLHRMQQKLEKPAAATTKECPYCRSTININATRCPNCTSDLK
ncbi:MAG TPA: large conductance mechanosensitive channel protein MscL, partial [Gammaproteobacteria bacterium]|nr:large conductance mechanosensitive channel protein MscL [Gammaproteobacteria bacterium]